MDTERQAEKVAINKENVQLSAVSEQLNRLSAQAKRGSSTKLCQFDLLRLYGEELPIAVLVIVRNRIRYVNQKFAELTGYDTRQLQRMKLSSLFAADQSKLAQKWIVKALAQEGCSENECRLVRKEGEVRWVTELCKPIWCHGSKGVVAYFIDITNQKQVETALRESSEFTSNLLNHSPIPVVVINPDTSIKYVNPALEKLTGFPRLKLLNKKAPYPWWAGSTLHRKKDYADLLVGMTRGHFGLEKHFKARDGNDIWVEAYSTPVITNGELKYYFSAWVDISEQKTLRENMQFYIDGITKAQEEEQKRIARELHDETIQSLASLHVQFQHVLDRCEVTSAHRQEMERFGTNIGEILEEVRRLSHELRPGLLEKLGLIPSFQFLIDELRCDQRISCSLNVAGAERYLPSEAQVMLFRIAQEAIRNIRKHSKATAVTIEIKFHKDSVKLVITDNGIGFKLPSTLGNLARSGKLGLIGVNERVHLLNGQLNIYSENGKGTQIEVFVPK